MMKQEQNQEQNQQQSKVQASKRISGWPFPPPGGPTGPLKGTRCKKVVVQTQEFDQAPF